ncbi:MAG: tRNA uridine-5-carboxymethylaminomethyl(34) synthesis GTPase MnmE [Ruminococcaceae bacterium]|nr:tRNA uridine-5-carboxymethylaminomethyl(34) synthesis GTPase MnmE [Oscillospiraceae bacterium]
MSTIAAISTPRGKGGIAVIRISGDDAIGVAERMFRARSGKALAECRNRSAIYGDILDASGNICDSGICVVFRGPNSFTGEDSCEISCHGGTYVTMTVLTSALAHGASPAAPGEFTKRAFINGKLSLTEAEAVGKLIDSDTEERMRLSSGAMRGNVSREIKKIADSLIGVMTALYAAIDYPDEDIGTEGEDMIEGVVNGALADVCRILDTYKTGKAVSDGVKTVICGRPNVGKSSLFNRMTGEDSAIVTSVAGTTRDILRESVSFGGITLRLSDTAGLHESDDVVEKIGIDRANDEIGKAELVMAVYTAEDCVTGYPPTELPSCPKIAVINKSDLYGGEAPHPAFVSYLKDSFDRVVLLSCTGNEANVCAALKGRFDELGMKTDIGIDGLAQAVSELYGSDKIDLTNDAVIWDVRQQASLSRAAEWLREASAALASGDSVDAVCTTVEAAAASLSETDGRGITEEIVDGIFHRFCVGK